ncbi:MAG: branched-chain amino acid transport system II carrier protein [Sediminicola sp.]
MYTIKETLVTAFALFSLFFGAGNLILPPLLGFGSGDLWWLVTIGFCLSAVFIPILGIFAHAKLQGTIFDFGEKVSPTFSLIYSLLVYAIAIALPSPRTASVTHEMAIQPFWDTPYLLTSILYFALVFLFVINRSKIMDIMGKVLTPAIILILLTIIGITIFSYDFTFGRSTYPNAFTEAILEGYQTFDAIGAVVVGGVIIVSINLRRPAAHQEKRTLLMRAGCLAGTALFLIYLGLILTGALVHSEFDQKIGRVALLNGISLKTLGPTANLLLGLLVGLACFTTAVGIVTGTSDFIKSRCNGSRLAYYSTAVVGCSLGVLMGQFNVAYIIAVALPALMFIYPITIVLILLNVAPNRFATQKVFRVVVVVTMLFSIPDFMGSIGFGAPFQAVARWIPLSRYSLGWVVPAIIAFVLVNAARAINPSRPIG